MRTVNTLQASYKCAGIVADAIPIHSHGVLFTVNPASMNIGQQENQDPAADKS